MGHWDKRAGFASLALCFGLDMEANLGRANPRASLRREPDMASLSIPCCLGLLKAETVTVRSIIHWAFSCAVSGAAGSWASSEDGAETNRVWCCFWGQVFQCGRSVSGLMAGGLFYFLTPFKMPTSDITISANSARIVQRALFCYKRVIGLGADLHGDMVDIGFLREVDTAISEVMAPSKKRQQVSSAKRQTTPEA